MSKPSQYSLMEGEWIGGTPYRVVRPLGMGGMGEVYEVDHTRAGTRRAIKLLRNVQDTCGNAARRLAREGRALGAIDHRNVVRVYEAGNIEDGRPYFAMQLLEGTTLRGLLARDHRLEPTKALRLMLQALEGLEAVHAAGIVHRDVKPTNLFVTGEETLKVLDFGVAKLLYGETMSPSTAEGLVLGTIRYMAPEQLSGGKVSYSTDVYAAAMVLFELIAGRRPFQELKHGDASVLARMREPAPRLSSHAGIELPSQLDDVVARALDREPSNRFASAKDFSQALRVASGELSPRSVEPHVASDRRAVNVQWVCESSDLNAGLTTQPWRLNRPLDRSSVSNAMVRLGLAASMCSLVLAGVAATVAIAGALSQSGSRAGIEVSNVLTGRVAAGAR